MMNDGSAEMLVANYSLRGYAFVDLGSKEGAARALVAAMTNGIFINDKRMKVEPSKKPVRPEGLKGASKKKNEKKRALAALKANTATSSKLSATASVFVPAYAPTGNINCHEAKEGEKRQEQQATTPPTAASSR